MLFVDGGNNRVGIMNSAPATSLHIGDSSGQQQIRMETDGGGASVKGTDTVNNASSGYTVGHLTGTDRYQLILGTIPIFDMYKTAVIFNEAGGDMDFRIESSGSANMLFVDSGNNRVGIGTSSVSKTLTVAGDALITTGDNSATLTLESTDADANAGPLLVLDRQSASPADGDVVGQIQFNGKNDAAEAHGYANIESRIIDASNATEDGRLELATSLAGEQGISRILMTNVETSINDNSKDLDFRVESNGQSEMLIVNAGTDKVGIKGNPAGANGVLQVTGSIGLTGNSEIRQSTNADDGSTLRFLGTQLVIANSNANGYGYSGGGFVASVSPSAGSITLDVGANSTSGHRLNLTNAGDGVQGFLNYKSGSNNRFSINSSSGEITVGNSTQAVTMMQLNHENSTGKGELQLNAHGSASFSMLSNFTGGTISGVATGNFGLITPHNAGISINTSDLERMKVDGSGNFVFNEGGVDADFRVESNLQANMLYVDGGNDIVNFNSTQTTSQLGASHRADGFQREFQRDTNVFSISQGASSGTGARTRRVTINLHNYSPVKITIMNGGHLYNNGGAFGFRETTFYVAMESTSFRVNVKVDGVNSGTYASSYGVPTIAAAGSNPACQIDFTVAAQLTCSTYVKVEGYGANAVLGIADV